MARARPLPRRRATVARATAAAAVALAAAVAAGSLGSTGAASAATGDRVRVRLTPVADVSEGTAVAVRRGDPALYVAEQDGRVLAVRPGTEPRPVLDLDYQTEARGEQGLLGIAFSPDGTKLYVHYTARDGGTRLVEYAFASGTADRASSRLVLAMSQPQANHNGGQVAFGPDGFLYLGLGDGGGAGDQGRGHAPGGNGQSLDTVLGKILRIDPAPSPASPTSAAQPYSIPPGNPFADGGGRPEIWAYGLRNPWRFSFDRKTGDLWIGDVGQNAWEEVDVARAGTGAGANYGWNVFEGKHRFRPGTAPGAVAPVFEYSHDDGCAIAGGFVYRGKRIPALRGAYVFTDYCNSRLRALRRTARGVRALDLGATGEGIAAFGQDARGELYALSQSDGLLRIDPA